MVEVIIEHESLGGGSWWWHTMAPGTPLRRSRQWLQEAGYSLPIEQCFPGMPETSLLAENIATGRYRP